LNEHRLISDGRSFRPFGVTDLWAGHNPRIALRLIRGYSRSRPTGGKASVGLLEAENE